jgi:hypothetical protein
LGVTPSAWFSSTKVLEIGSNGASVFSFTGGVGAVILTSNAYYSATGWRYASTGVATNYDTGEGKYRWNIAASGTAGDAITFTQAMTLDASGNLGVGTTSPNIAGVSNAITLNTTNGTAGAIYEIGLNGANYAYLFANASNTVLSSVQSLPLLFKTNDTERARIDSSGNLLIGTTAMPSASAGGAGFEPSSDARTVLKLGSTTTAATTLQVFLNPNGAVGTIQTSASLTLYNTTSDYRLKNITGPIKNSGAYIDSLNPVEGTWKVDGSTFVGLIAHEAQEASRTQVATGIKDGAEMQAMDYSNSELIANLIAEVKSLRKRLADAGI